MTRPSSEQARLALKTALRAQVRACGGQEAAADTTRVGQPALSRYASPHHPNEHVPVDVLLDLILDTNNPSVLRQLCRQAGGVFVPLPNTNKTPMIWTKAVFEAVGHNGKAVDAFGRALADDGDVSAQEIRDMNIREHLARLLETVVLLDRFAEQVLEDEEAS